MSKTVKVSGFPSSTTAGAVQVFLESHTGGGTVEALKIREIRTGGARKYAIVQFTTTRAAEQIISLANPRLWYGHSYLNARPMDRDIIPQPRSFLHTMESVTLHFGYQTSKEKFSAVWSGNNVSVNFGLGMRKLHFFLSHNLAEYKLNLLFENIWQIELHRPRGQTVKYLLIQVVFKYPNTFVIVENALLFSVNVLLLEKIGFPLTSIPVRLWLSRKGEIPILSGSLVLDLSDCWNGMTKLTVQKRILFNLLDFRKILCICS